MLRKRIIPCLLLQNKGLVKTVKFSNPTYIGDPLNAVRIFNEKEVDELIFLDITASKENRKPDYTLIREIASECFMPFSYGGGITTLEEITRIFSEGAEKVVINSAAIENPSLIKEASSVCGSQSIIVGIDVKKNLFREYRVYHSGKRKLTKIDPVQHALEMEKMGAGEIFLNSVDGDGLCTGYDLGLIKKFASVLNTPFIFCGGAGKLDHFKQALDAGAPAAAAGSFFVFYGKHRAVLITYPDKQEFIR